MSTAATSMFLTRAALTALLISAPSLPNVGATQPTATLICTNLVSGVNWHITINYGNSTVDSYPARVDGAQISWHDAKDGGNYTLDRKTGQLTVIVASSTGGYFLHDRCRLEQ